VLDGLARIALNEPQPAEKSPVGTAR
jgi:hypothetical protein